MGFVDKRKSTRRGRHRSTPGKFSEVAVSRKTAHSSNGERSVRDVCLPGQCGGIFQSALACVPWVLVRDKLEAGSETAPSVVTRERVIDGILSGHFNQQGRSARFTRPAPINRDHISVLAVRFT